VSLTTPPAIVQTFANEIVATTSWTGDEATSLWYPIKPDFTGVTFPIGVIAVMAPRRRIYAEGAGPLLGGTLRLVIYSNVSIGALETLAQAMLTELLSAYSGIPYTSAECGISSDPSPAKVAGGAGIYSIALDLPYGLEI
jgi:hypothetical protein